MYHPLNFTAGWESGWPEGLPCGARAGKRSGSAPPRPGSLPPERPLGQAGQPVPRRVRPCAAPMAALLPEWPCGRRGSRAEPRGGGCAGRPVCGVAGVLRGPARRSPPPGAPLPPVPLAWSRPRVMSVGYLLSSLCTGTQLGASPAARCPLSEPRALRPLVLEETPVVALALRLRGVRDPL